MGNAAKSYGEETNQVRLGELLSTDLISQLGTVQLGTVQPGAVQRGAVQKSTSTRLVPQEAIKNAQAILKKTAIPNASHELWRQTAPDLFPLEALLQAESVESRVEPFGKNGPVGSVNVGRVNVGSAPVEESELLPLPPGVEWSQDAKASDELLRDVFGPQSSDLDTDAIAQFVACTSRAGGILRVKAGTKLAVPLRMLQWFGTERQTTQSRAGAPVFVVSVESGASCTLLEDLDSSVFGESSGGNFYAPRVEVVVAEKARCEFVSVQRLPTDVAYLGRHRFHLMKDAELRSVHMSVGASVSRLDLDCKLYETGAHADLYSLYLANGERHVDLHTTQRHLAPHCRSNLYCKGAATDEARAVYFGFIRVAEHAQKTDAYQKNRNLLLSDSARADAIPNLEILANDVKCSHGASVGQVGTEELFYLMSRGISRAEAERILVQAFFEDLVGKIENPFVKSYVEEVVSGIFATVV